ncbi:hypothetical protein [Undibacterium parvum]|uniref:Uncharacterized protein n=2 Tax=Undibacterium TaxID=401469 RepID=A0A6M4A8G2_9BURK|nr:hypothetical protein [Undibacterium parvum]AZP11956.1 hypothetical protein EJN92_08010 [Undibacterium parvum]QJQ06329.1 hypothetical protein EJG51_011195 [Undibacterium piscinae]
MSLIFLLVMPVIAHAEEEQRSPNEMGVILLSEATTPKFYVLCKKLFDEKTDVATAESLKLAYREFRERQKPYFEKVDQTIHALSGQDQIQIGLHIGYYSQNYSNALAQLDSERQEAFCRSFIELLERRQFDPGSFPSDALMKFLGKN